MTQKQRLPEDTGALPSSLRQCIRSLTSGGIVRIQRGIRLPLISAGHSENYARISILLPGGSFWADSDT